MSARRSQSRSSSASRQRAALAKSRPQGTRAKAARARAGSTLTLGTGLTIAELAGVHRAFCGMLERGAISLDARSLQSVDTAGLQWLLVAGRSAQQRGVRLRLRGGTRLLEGSAAALGIAADLAAAVECHE
jgi:ABC-type transporter Mla MlaB component